MASASPIETNQGSSQGGGGGGGGGSLGSEEPPQTKKGPPKGPLECTKRSTITICLVNIDLDTIEDLNKLLSNQLGHACSKIIHRKVLFFHAKNLPAKLPGYGLANMSKNFSLLDFQEKRQPACTSSG